MGRAAGILLGAGASKRFGMPKQLLPIGKEPMILKVLRAALASRLQEIILVLGHCREEVLKVLEGLGGEERLKVVFNPDYPSGISSSLKTGISNIGAGVDAFMVLLGDMPLLTPQVIDHLLASYYGAKVLCAYYWLEGRIAHPVILSLSLKEHILGLQGDVGAREIVKDLQERGLALKVRPLSGHGAWDLDIDTPEDFHRFKSSSET